MPNVSSGASKTAVTYSVKWFGFDAVGGGFELQFLDDRDGADATGGGRDRSKKHNRKRQRAD